MSNSIQPFSLDELVGPALMTFVLETLIALCVTRKRHRVQLNGLIVLCQFYGGIGLLKKMLSPVHLPRAPKAASLLHGDRP